MFKLPEEDSSEFVKQKIEYDTISQACKIAKKTIANRDNDEDSMTAIRHKELESLLRTKAEYRDQYMAMISNIVDTFFRRRLVESNLIEIGEGWYGIAYYISKDKVDLKIDYVITIDFSILERTHGEEYHSRIDLEAILPACIDEVALGVYKQTLVERAKEYLREEAPECYKLEYVYKEKVVKEPKRVVSPLCASIHSQKRWIERKLKPEGITSDSAIELYRRDHAEEVSAQIIEGMKGATKVWEDADHIDYYFGKDNIMYVVGGANIITVYEEDFGFSKSINRSIVLQQVEVLKEYYGILTKEIKDYNIMVERSDKDIESLNKAMEELQSKIDCIKESKRALVSAKDDKRRKVMSSRMDFEKEYDKLFKKPTTWMDRR